jgi:hypothetical protein
MAKVWQSSRIYINTIISIGGVSMMTIIAAVAIAVLIVIGLIVLVMCMDVPSGGDSLALYDE